MKEIAYASQISASSAGINIINSIIRLRRMSKSVTKTQRLASGGPEFMSEALIVKIIASSETSTAAS